MVTININNHKYKIPERLTVEQYHAALQFDWEDPKYYPMIVSQLTGAPIALLTKANEEAMTLAIAMIVKSMNDRQECKTLDLESLTFGEFVDLDVYLALGLDKHFLDIVGLIAPDAKWADEAMWAIDKFAQFRTYTYRQYKVLFGLTDKDLDEAQINGDTEVKDKLSIARSWYKVIVSLAHDNILHIDHVTEQPLKKVLNFMALQKEKVMEENEQKLKQRRQYDLQRTRR
jgi:hypothetical protein